MKFSLNESSYDEYKEVESPFSRNRVENQAENLSFRKNILSRPFATESSSAPTYVDSPARKIANKRSGDLVRNKLQGTQTKDHDFSFNHDLTIPPSRRNSLEDEPIEYLERDEASPKRHSRVRVSTKNSRKISPKVKTRAKNSFLSKASLVILGSLVLRLIFMDRGVWDYFSTEALIKSKEQDYRSILRENQKIEKEIVKIKTDSNYQKHLAKEHLGVIASDEFLILFAGGVGTSAVAGIDMMLESKN